MVIYEVNLEILAEIYTEYFAWLIPHIKEMLTFNGFVKADVYELSGRAKDKTHVSITVSYLVDSDENLQRYLNTSANKMRENGLKRFGGKFQANRRILNLTHSYTPDPDD